MNAAETDKLKKPAPGPGPDKPPAPGPGDPPAPGPDKPPAPLAFTGIKGSPLPLAPATPGKRGRKAGGKNAPKSGDLADLDMIIPLAYLVEMAGDAIAAKTNNPAWKLRQAESRAIQDGFNYWLNARLPMLKDYYPEVMLLSPIAAYVIRATGQAAPIQDQADKK
jgi:hypothetical protein